MLQRVPHDWAMSSAHHTPVQLLIESSDPALTVSDFSRFHDAGFSVALCRAGAEGPGRCAVLQGGRCELLASADLVLRHLDSHAAVQLAAQRQGEGPHVLTVGDGGDIPATAPMDSQIRALRQLLSGI